MHARLSLALGLATIILPAQAMAAEERAFDVPRASLSTSLPLLSRQGGVSISVSDPALWRTRMRPVRGRMSVDEAIRQMLDGTGVRLVDQIDSMAIPAGSDGLPLEAGEPG